MGRSRPTYRQSLERMEKDLEPFRRALRKKHQPAFDRVFEHAQYHAMPAKAADRGDLGFLFLFSVVVGQQLELMELREVLEEGVESS